MAERPLHVAVDGRELVGRPTGVGRYLLEILRQWRARPDDTQYTVILHADPPAAASALGPRFTWVVERDRAGGTWWEQRRLPRVLRRVAPDVLFAPAYTAPLLAPCPTVVLVHDVSFFAHPEWFAWREGLRRRWLTRAAARRARAVVTVSGFSRSEIDRYLGVGGDRVVLAPPGSPRIARGPSPPRAPVVLHVGSLFQRRHLPEMLDAFALVARTVPAARLVLIGDNRTSPRQDPRELAGALGIADRVDWREYVSDDELDDAYRSARVFLFLSDYEGFAMTPLEAAARGVPSVLLDTPVAREVYGDAAVRVPLDPPRIAAAIGRLLVDDAAHAAAAAGAGARLESYSWSASAAAILRALNEARR